VSLGADAVVAPIYCENTVESAWTWVSVVKAARPRRNAEWHGMATVRLSQVVEQQSILYQSDKESSECNGSNYDG
jgi:DhnA family fructose-bisphosphate aldolase class Ia